MNVTLFFITCIASLRVTLAQLNVTVQPREIVLAEGDTLHAMCSVKQPISGCKWVVINRLLLLEVMKPGSYLPRGMKYFGRGLEYGECGITIPNALVEQSDIYVCLLNVGNQRVKENVTVIVSSTLNTTYNLHINVTRIDPVKEEYPNNTFEENKRILAECQFESVRPEFNISWFIGNKRIEDGVDRLEVEDIGPIDKGLKIVRQNFTRKLTYLDNGKNLICALYFNPSEKPHINHPLITLIVYFSPKLKRIEQSAFRIGQSKEIIVTTDANPRPTIEWFADGENITEGNTDATGTLYAYNLVARGKHTWEAVLRIDNARPEDVKKNYTFTARNIAGKIEIGVVILVRHAASVNFTAFLPLSAACPTCFTEATICPSSFTNFTASLPTPSPPTSPPPATPPAEITSYSSLSLGFTITPPPVARTAAYSIPSTNLTACPSDVTGWIIAGIVTQILIIILIKFLYSRLNQRRSLWPEEMAC